ncbi:branched-chain amino acid ABC transporter permease [Dactylosporangium roseum]|uniref:branched-chain amino acid ABC transporter permease n=1 Tax=Dactylosporangium roseum TaxID=47989 RepID=UPI0021B1D71C|nr:branched-chain amino acid ABC transporter permease [Dactylosporangium roseum]
MRRAVIMLTAFLACVMLSFGVGATSAWAEGEALQGTLTSNGAPVAGVKIKAFTQDGAPVGEATSDEQGKWSIPVPGAGSYKIDLDQSTLPSGVTVTNGRPSLTPSVADGQARNVLFPLGGGSGGAATGDQNQPAPSAPSEWDRIANLFYSGIHFSLIIALAALGISLIFGTTGLTNFAHGELVTFGALITFLFNVTIGLPLVLSGLVAVAVGAAMGYVQDRAFWGWLRKRRTNLVTMMIISIGLSLAVRYLFLYFFGGDSRAFAEYNSQPGEKYGPFLIAPKNLVADAIAITVLVAVSAALLMTRLGKATRAVADNPALAAASGINVDRIIRLVWTIGGGLAALSGVLLGVYQNVSFQMGFQILLLIFAAVTLGGFGTAWGALLGSLVIGLFIQFSTYWIPSELKNVSALAALILILLFRPQGILGRRTRIG